MKKKKLSICPGNEGKGSVAITQKVRGKVHEGSGGVSSEHIIQLSVDFCKEFWSLVLSVEESHGQWGMGEDH